MRKVFKYFIFTIILSFSLCFKVNAECSYSERKDMLNAAKAIEITMEIVEKEENQYEFKYYVTNVPKNLFVTYYNNNNAVKYFISYEDLTDGIYTFTDSNYTLVYDYVFEITSLNESCFGYELLTKKVKKPMYNTYSENVNCGFEEYSNFKYCKKFIEQDYNLTEKKFYDSLKSYNKTLPNIKEDSETKKKNFFEENLVYVIGVPIVLAISITAIVLIRKKKNEL